LNFNLGGKCTYRWGLCRITVTDAGAISAFNNLASDGTSTLTERCLLVVAMATQVS